MRTRILDAARRLFIQDGYDAVSMRKIADAIEYSPTAIYQYFRDKSELVLALCEADFENWGRRFFALRDIPDPVERLRRSMKEYVRFAVESPAQYRLMFMSDHISSLDQAALRRAYESDQTKGDPDRDSYSLLIRSIEEAMAAGALRPADSKLVAQTVWCALHGLCALHITHKNDPWPQWRPLEQRIDSMIDTVLRGLSADEPRVAKAPVPKARVSSTRVPTTRLPTTRLPTTRVPKKAPPSTKRRKEVRSA